MVLRTVSRDWIVCPGCGEKHGECVDWVKSMPHRERCSCGAEILCWFESEITYHAEMLGEVPGKKKGKETKSKKRKAKAKDVKKKDLKKKKKNKNGMR